MIGAILPYIFLAAFLFFLCRYERDRAAAKKQGWSKYDSLNTYNPTLLVKPSITPQKIVSSNDTVGEDSVIKPDSHSEKEPSPT